MQEKLARILTNGIYRISPQSQPDKCLGTYDNGTSDSVQLYSEECNELNQKWNIIWFRDGTYRLSSQSSSYRVLDACNTTTSIGGVQISTWSGDFNQEWALSSQGSNLFHIGPRNAWWRVLTVYETSHIAIVNYTSSDLPYWIITTVS